MQFKSSAEMLAEMKAKQAADTGTTAKPLVDSFIPKRPKDQTYSVPWEWRDSSVPVEERRDDEGNLCPTRLQRLAARLRKARANIRALTPPETEDEQELQTAA